MANYTFFCLCQGDQSTFPVVIPHTANVNDLRTLIYEKRKRGLFRDIDAEDLILFKINTDFETLQCDVSELTENDFSPTLKLFNSRELISQVWEDQPRDDINVFVQTGVGNLISFPPSSLRPQAAIAPSSIGASVGKYKKEQVDHPIFNGRPNERRGPPVAIYNESLAKLKHELCNLADFPEPSADCIANTAGLFHTVASTYDSEAQRGNEIYSCVERLLGTTLTASAEKLKMATEVDALVVGYIQMFGKKEAVIAYVTLKNEHGICGDAGLQAALSLRKYVTGKHYDDIRDASCCPSIIVSIAGPFLQIAGSVFVDAFSVQNFTGYTYIGGNTFEIRQVYHVAKIFGAVARAVEALQREYFYLLPDSRPEFRSPSPTYLPDSPFPFPESLDFKGRYMYEGRNPESYRQSLFLADYKGKMVVVKFCERYSEDAHKTLAAAGLAPTLHFASKVLGGVFMVVMDLVTGRDAYHEFRHRNVPRTVLDDVKRGLEKLHDAQLVYGDVRRPNILAVKVNDRSKEKDEDEWRGLLIDFDWSGRIGEVKYPPTLNTSGEIAWTKGVEPASEIRPKHDLDMLERIKRGTDEWIFTSS